MLYRGSVVSSGAVVELLSGAEVSGFSVGVSPQAASPASIADRMSMLIKRFISLFPFHARRFPAGVHCDITIIQLKHRFVKSLL